MRPEDRESNHWDTSLEMPRAWKGVPCKMTSRKEQKARFALAIARGDSVAAWARQNNVPRRTAFRWAKEPGVRRAVESWRRRALERAIGRMAGLAMKAADGIAGLAKGAESESVQLRAWRAILADQMAVSRFSSLEHRMAEIEEQLHERARDTDHAG